MIFSGVTILQGVEFPIFPIDFAWALQQCSATALPVMWLTGEKYDWLATWQNMTGGGGLVTAAPGTIGSQSINPRSFNWHLPTQSWKRTKPWTVSKCVRHQDHVASIQNISSAVEAVQCLHCTRSLFGSGRMKLFQRMAPRHNNFTIQRKRFKIRLSQLQRNNTALCATHGVCTCYSFNNKTNSSTEWFYTGSLHLWPHSYS